MKSIALIVTRMIPGGASKVVRQIITGGRGIFAFTLFTGPEDINEEIIKDLASLCEVIIIPSLVRNISPLKDYFAYKELICELRKQSFDVVHTHTSKAGFIGRLAAAKVGVSTVIHSPHGSIYTEGSNIDGVPAFSLGKKILQFAEKIAGKNTTWLTALSEHEKKICIKLGLSTEENTVVIYNGIDSEKFLVTEEERETVRESFGFKEEDIALLSVGRLSVEKGHAVLINAFKKVLVDKEKGQNPKVPEDNRLSLIIVGDGPERKTLEEQTNQLGIDDIVDIVGHCDDVKKYLAAADIFILPSLYEGFGLAVVEAMAADLPVLVSNVGGLPEIISDGREGYLVVSSDSISLAEKMNVLMKSPEQREKMGKAGELRAKDFSIEKMLESYFKLYA